jgi:hypothetical protein
MFPSRVEPARSSEPLQQDRTVLLGGTMRMGTVKSELIEKVGYDNGMMRVEYSDGAVFDYFKISLSTYKALLRSHHIGTDWLALRGQYKFKRV